MEASTWIANRPETTGTPGRRRLRRRELGPSSAPDSISCGIWPRFCDRRGWPGRLRGRTPRPRGTKSPDCRISVDTCECQPHACDDLSFSPRLVDVIRCAQRACPNTVVRVASSADDDDGYVASGRVRSKRAQRLEAGYPGHHKIEEDHVDPVLDCGAQDLITVRSLNDGVTFILELRRQRGADVRLVVGD